MGAAAVRPTLLPVLPVKAALLVLLSLFWVPALAQPPVARYRVRHLTVPDGLPSGAVFFLHQDARGFMWMGTSDGVARFDGRNWQRFYSSSTGHSINTLGLIEVPNGDILVGSNRGIKRYVLRKNAFEEADDLPVRDIAFPFHLRGNRLWLLTEEEGLMIIDLLTRRKTRLLDPATTPANNPLRRLTHFQNRYLGVDPSENVWVDLPEKGLLRYNPVRRRYEYWFSERADNAFGPPLSVTALRCNRDGTLWLGTREGLVHFSLQTRAMRIFTGPYDFNQTPISSLAEGPDGLLWLATEGSGIVQFDPRTDHFTNPFRRVEGEPNSLQFDHVASLYVDRQGQVWANTEPLGVDILFPYPPGHRFYSRTSPVGTRLSDFSVRGLAEDALGNVWIGTQLGGLNVLNPRQDRIVAQYRHQPGNSRSLVSDGIRHLLTDERGRLWVATRNGLCVTTPLANGQTTGFETIPLPPDLVDRDIVGLCPLPGERMLLSTPSGLWLLDERRRHVRRLKAQISVGSGAPHFDPARNLVLVQERHQGFDAYRLEGDSLRHLKWLMPPGDVHSFYQPPGSARVYACTSEGLLLFNLETLRIERSWGRAEGLVPEANYDLLPDGQGNLYLNGNQGLLFFDPKRNLFNPVGEVPVREYNHQASLRARDGLLYFGSTTGLDRLLPDRIQSLTAPRSVELTELTVNGIVDSLNVNVLHERVLPAGSNHLVFRFATIDFLGEGRSQFRYRLDGFDADTMYAGTVGEAHYTNLFPGLYTFWVQASDARGLSYTPPRRLRVRILAPFWQTRWFQWTMALLLLALVGLGVRLFLRQRLRRQQTEYEQVLRLELERNRIARDMHDDLGSSLFSIKNSAQIALRQPTLEATRQEVTRLLEQTRYVVQQVREIIWAVTAHNDTPENFVGYLRRYVHQFGDETGLTVQFAAPEPLPTESLSAEPLSGELRRQLFLVLKEALHNVRKHAEAREVRVQISFEPLTVQVTDDGKGIRPDPGGAGYGLRNMTRRTEELGGRFRVESAPGAGTTVTITVPPTLLNDRQKA